MRKFLLLLFFAFVFIGLSTAKKHKAVSILGDSYSTFESHVQPDTNYVWYFKNPKFATDVVDVSQTWWSKLIEDKKFKLEVNNSFSGSTICNTGYHQADYSDRSFITRLDKLGNPDLIFVFGATNDSWAGAPIGEYKYADFSKDDLYSFRPALAYLLENLKIKYPKAKLFFILNSELKEQINESVSTICEYYKVKYIALKGIDKKAGHPSVKGMQQIDDQIKEYLKSAK